MRAIASYNKSELFAAYPDCVSVPQIQEMLGIGRNSIYELLQAGEIKNKKIGRKYIIRKQSVIDYLES